MALPKTDRILGIDPGWRNIGIVSAIWSGRIRRVTYRKTIETTQKMTDREAWDAIISGLQSIIADPGCPDVIACEDMRGVRYGHDERGTSNSSTDEIRDVQAVIRTLAHLYGKRLFFVRSLSGYAAMGAKISKLRGETQHIRKARQKAASAAAAMRVFSGAENLTEHEWDACVHAGAVMLGKGEEQ
jgi:hypothetical protein